MKNKSTAYPPPMENLEEGIVLFMFFVAPAEMEHNNIHCCDSAQGRMRINLWSLLFRFVGNHKLVHRSCNTLPRRIVQLSELGREFAAVYFHRQPVVADFADLHCRPAYELGSFNDFHGDNFTQ